MRSPRFGQLRYLRAVVFAAVIMLVGVTAHAAGGGRLPSFAHGTVIFFLVFWACVVLTRWRLPLPAVLAVLGIGEFALHEALMVATSSMPGAISGAGAGSAAGSMGSMGGSMTGSTGSMGGHMPESMHAVIAGDSMATGLAHPGAMLSFHIVATALTAVALSHGENAVWRLWAWMSAHLVRTVRFRQIPLSTLRARRQPATPAPCPILRTAPLRGPPHRQFA